MRRLHAGHRPLARVAGAAGTVLTALIAACLALGVAAAPAAAEPIGGGQLASPLRTVALGPEADPLPPVKAATWVLADAETGEVLAHKGAHVRRAPASTLKMLTALAVLPNTSPDATYVATRRAATIYGARVGLRPGKTYTLDQLWYAVFLPSANDAAIAVAQANGGVRKTIRQMNEVAYELRALDTVAKNTSGLDSPGQLSSAYDLALFARAGLKRDDFASYASTARAQFPDVKGKGSHPIYTTNRLLLHGWKGAIGVKTGFTSKAGRTYVGAARRGDRTLIVSLMGVTEASETAAKKLLRWGFANADRVTPVGALVEPGSEIPSRDPGEPAPVDPATVADRPSSTGVATTAAAPAPGEAGGVPPIVILVAVGVVVGTGAVVASRRFSRSSGRHAA